MPVKKKRKFFIGTSINIKLSVTRVLYRSTVEALSVETVAAV